MAAKNTTHDFPGFALLGWEERITAVFKGSAIARIGGGDAGVFLGRGRIGQVKHTPEDLQDPNQKGTASTMNFNAKSLFIACLLAGLRYIILRHP